MKNTINNYRLKTIRQLLFALIIIVYPSIIIAQATSQISDGSTFVKLENLENLINNKLNIHQENLKATEINGVVLDSIEELVFKEFYLEKNKTYFEYSSNGQLISSEKKFDTDRDLDVYTIEYCTYNGQEEITDIIRKDIGKQVNLTDTSVIVYSEKNNYTDGNLIAQNISRSIYSFFNGVFSMYDTLTFTNSFQYNKKNQLIYSNIFSIWNDYSLFGDYEEKFCYYDSNDLLKFIYRSGYLLRYDYDTIDRGINKYEKLSNELVENNVELFDSVEQWYSIICDEITYDTLERVKTLRNTTTYYFDSINWYNFKAHFNYNSDNKIVHASYYTYNDETDSTSYYEETRIDNVYDSDGNILEYHKTFYDRKDKQWKTHTKRTYYYSDSKKAVSVENEKLNQVSVYPNPANCIINLTLPSDFEGTYSIYNLSGQLLVNTKSLSPTIEISTLQKGIYFLMIQNHNETQVLKFVKE